MTAQPPPANEAAAPPQAVLSAAQWVRRACAAVFDIDEALLIGPSRLRELTVPRQATCYVLHQRFPNMSYPALGRFMGGRDHSTIIHAVKVTQARLAHDPELAGKVSALIGGALTGKQHDSHVIQWLFWQRTSALMLEMGDAEVVARGKEWCNQCDAAIDRATAARCQSRFCSLRAEVAARLFEAAA